jgi:hypothetical protein
LFKSTNSYSNSEHLPDSQIIQQSDKEFFLSQPIVASQTLHPTDIFAMTQSFKQTMEFFSSDMWNETIEFDPSELVERTFLIASNVQYSHLFRNSNSYSNSQHLPDSQIIRHSNMLLLSLPIVASETLDPTELFAATQSFTQTMQFNSSDIWDRTIEFDPSRITERTFLIATDVQYSHLFRNSNSYSNSQHLPDSQIIQQSNQEFLFSQRIVASQTLYPTPISAATQSFTDTM